MTTAASSLLPEPIDDLTPLSSRAPSPFVDRNAGDVMGDKNLLLDLPPEIIHLVLVQAGTDDLQNLVTLSQTSPLLAWYIYQDPDRPSLYRRIHNALYDDPRSSTDYLLNLPKNADADGRVVSTNGSGGGSRTVEWQEEVLMRSWVERALRRGRLNLDDVRENANNHIDEVGKIAKTLLTALTSLPAPTSPTHPPPPSLNTPWLTHILTTTDFQPLFITLCKVYRTINHSSLHGPITRSRARLPVTEKLYAVLGMMGRVHASFSWGPTPDADGNFDTEYVSDHHRNLGIFRSLTYSISSLSSLNDFGPFHPDGTVDWLATAAITSVMDANVQYASGRGVGSAGGAGGEVRQVSRFAADLWRAARGLTEGGLEGVRGLGVGVAAGADGEAGEGEMRDWAGVEVDGEPGVWRGTYAFLDYTDWLEFNYSRFTRDNRHPTLEDHTEAVGDYMRQKMTLTVPPAIAALPEITSPLPRSDLLPVLKFSGKSRYGGGDIEGQSIRGEVVLTPDGQVRWTWVVRYAGEDRWRLSGVQIGGPQSPRGIIGIWTGADRDMEDAHTPCGPFAYWKIGTEEDDKVHLAAVLGRGGAGTGTGVTWFEALQGGEIEQEESEGEESAEETEGGEMEEDE